MKLPNARSSIVKIASGMTGFDEITEGGLPAGRTTLVMGGAGCGKTVFALQALVNAARASKHPGIFVAFEESTKQILTNAGAFGWDLPGLARKNSSFSTPDSPPMTFRPVSSISLACSARSARERRRCARR
jgi:KaiC/GvpD/RAD55 family RecA-like ATPase